LTYPKRASRKHRRSSSGTITYRRGTIRWPRRFSIASTWAMAIHEQALPNLDGAYVQPFFLLSSASGIYRNVRRAWASLYSCLFFVDVLSIQRVFVCENTGHFLCCIDLRFTKLQTKACSWGGRLCPSQDRVLHSCHRTMGVSPACNQYICSMTSMSFILCPQSAFTVSFSFSVSFTSQTFHSHDQFRVVTTSP
jgi:hypothetical protein